MSQWTQTFLEWISKDLNHLPIFAISNLMSHPAPWPEGIINTQSTKKTCQRDVISSEILSKSPYG